MRIKHDKPMYVIIWEYQAKADLVIDFEKTYSTSGEWAKLFKQGEGFLGTELLRDEKYPHRYITIDRWVSSKDYETFLSQWKAEYAVLDAQCETLTEQETLLGEWESIPPEIR